EVAGAIRVAAEDDLIARAVEADFNGQVRHGRDPPAMGNRRETAVGKADVIAGIVVGDGDTVDAADGVAEDAFGGLAGGKQAAQRRFKPGVICVHVSLTIWRDAVRRYKAQG